MAVVLAWAGGAFYIRQADSALQVLGADRQETIPGWRSPAAWPGSLIQRRLAWLSRSPR
jgi:hypothetical protein